MTLAAGQCLGARAAQITPALVLPTLATSSQPVDGVRLPGTLSHSLTGRLRLAPPSRTILFAMQVRVVTMINILGALTSRSPKSRDSLDVTHSGTQATLGPNPIITVSSVATPSHPRPSQPVSWWQEILTSSARRLSAIFVCPICVGLTFAPRGLWVTTKQPLVTRRTWERSRISTVYQNLLRCLLLA